MPRTEKRGWFTATLLGFGLSAVGLIASLAKRPARTRDRELIHRDVMYEARDVDASVIGWVAVAVLVAAFLIYVVVRTSFGYFSRSEFRNRQAVTLVQQKARTPAVPLLQVNPALDLERLRQSERTTLNSYGWVDQGKGIVRIPIEEAMKRVLANGLPPAEKAAPTPAPKAPDMKARDKREAKRSASPLVSKDYQGEGLKGRDTRSITPFQGWSAFACRLPGATRFALAPGCLIPRLWRCES